MRNFLSILTLLFITNIYAQVGIGTTNPGQKLDVAGTDPTTETIRIQSLNEINNPGAHDGNGTPAPIAVNANGDVVTYSPMKLVQNTSSFINPVVPVTSNDGTFVSNPIYTAPTLTLTKDTMVEINTIVSVGISMPNDTPITDGVNRKYGIELYINNVNVARAADGYTNGETDPSGNGANATVTYNSGYFTLHINYKVMLSAGTHTFRLNGQVTGQQGSNTDGVKAEFGDTLNYSLFQVITYN